MDLNPYVLDFARALLAEAALKWVPLTEELLNSLDSTDHQLKDTVGQISTGYYECRHAGYPHGFIVNNRWVDARYIVEILNPQRV